MPHIIHTVHYVHRYIVLLLYHVCRSYMCICVLCIGMYWYVLCVLPVMYVCAYNVYCTCIIYVYSVCVCACVCIYSSSSDHPLPLQEPVGQARLAGFRAAPSVPGLRTVALGTAVFLGAGACPCVGPCRGAGQGGSWPNLAGTGSPCVGGTRQQQRGQWQQQ